MHSAPRRSTDSVWHGIPPSTKFGALVGRPESLDTGCNPSSGVRLGVLFRRACGRRVCDFDVSRRHSVGVSPDGVPRALWSCGVTQVYDDGDLSLTSTSLVDVPVLSTQAYADDLPPVSSMPPPPVPKRVTVRRKKPIELGTTSKWPSWQTILTLCVASKESAWSLSLRTKPRCRHQVGNPATRVAGHGANASRSWRRVSLNSHKSREKARLKGISLCEVGWHQKIPEKVKGVQHLHAEGSPHSFPLCPKPTKAEM